MMVIGRGHTVYIDNKSIDYNGQTYTTPYKVVVYVDGEQVAKLRDKERGMATCIGQTFKMTLEITQEKGGSEEMVDVANGESFRVQKIPMTYSGRFVAENEPTGNLDSVNGVEVMELLSELNRQGTTIIIVTHSQRDATYAHRIIRLLDGQIVSENINRPLEKSTSSKNEAV